MRLEVPYQYFNPRSYKRSDHDLLLQKLCQLKFQSTLLQEERRSRSEAWGHVPKFQSTLLQEERHNTDDACTDGLHISIHAPTRGATIFLVFFEPKSEFQSTLLQEERPQDNMVMQIGKMISIHAPTRGATQLHVRLSLKWSISIHAPTRGATAEMR